MASWRIRRARSRTGFNPILPARPNSSASEPGRSASVRVISPASAIDTPPARTDSSVWGHCASPVAVSNAVRAAPVVVPFSPANHSGASANPAARCAPQDAARAADNVVAASQALPSPANSPAIAAQSDPEYRAGSNAATLARMARSSARETESDTRTPPRPVGTKDDPGGGRQARPRGV